MKVKIGNIIVRTTIGIIISAAALSSAAQPPDVVVRRLSDRVLVLNVHGAQSTNVVALKSEKGVVVVDTEVSPVFAAAIRKAIEREFGAVPISFVVNTHGHGDHTYGNQVFPDALIIGHEAAGPAMEAGEERRRATAVRLAQAVAQLESRLETLPPDSEPAAALETKISYFESMRRGLGNGFQLTIPTFSFSEDLKLDLGDLTLELKWFGLSHSDSDVLIYCPEEGLLMTGDLFAPGNEPYVDSERIAQFPRWIENLEEIEARSASLTSIVPGHGEPFAPADLEPILAFVLQQDEKYSGKESGFFEVKEAFETESIEAGLQSLRRAGEQPERYYLIHSELDSYAFHMMMEDRVDDALQIFLTLAELFPESDLAFDSLGEARIRRGEDDLAAAGFRRALELNPENRNAAKRLAELKAQ
jgi:glyoxylase-like metal-dependent hydrolase (beta-lactamase superfamily II)